MAELNKIKIIGEIGINHNASLKTTFRIIDAAKFAGFDYIKFQKRNPNFCVPEDQKLKMKNTPWGQMTYLEYKHRMEFDKSKYNAISQYCLRKNIEWFASVWDIDSAKFMKDYSNIVKIPSALITDLELLEYCRNKFETVIISTAMSDQDEIDVAASYADVIMHCCGSYPARTEDLNLNYIHYLKDKFKKPVGYSGHEEGLSTTFATCSMGVEWIERHITLDHSMWGSDQRASIEPIGQIKLIKGIRDIEKAMGKKEKRQVLECELEKRKTLRK